MTSWRSIVSKQHFPDKDPMNLGLDLLQTKETDVRRQIVSSAEHSDHIGAEIKQCGG